MNNHFLKISVALIMGGLTWSLPAHAGLLSDEEARQGVADLKTQQSVLSRQQQTLDERVTRMESALQGYPDLVMRLDSLSQDMAQLRGRVDSLANQLDAEDKRFHDLYVDLDSRLKVIESALPKPEGAPDAGVGTPPPPAAGDANPSAPKVAAENGSSTGVKSADSGTKGSVADGGAEVKAPPSDYDAALDVFNSGNYAKSLKLFEGFLKANPKDEKVPNALYWVGMNQLLLKDYKGARVSNQHLYKSYPESPKAPDGLLNLAAAWMGLGEPATAKATWKMIIAKYPKSSAAAKAKVRLREH
jgi:tol-pal system protein YbgF